MVVETERRRGRLTRLLAARQTAEGTLVDSFLGANTATLWFEDSEIPAGARKSDQPQWMTEDFGDETLSRYSLQDAPSGQFLLRGTAESLEFMLRNNWGSFAAGAFTLVSQIPDTEFLTFAWIESSAAGATQKLVRLVDVHVHTIEFVLDRATGLLNLLCSFNSGGPVDIQDLDALPGGVFLPAPPMKPSDQAFLRVRGATWTRDPTGLDVDLRFVSLSVTLDAKGISEFSMMDGASPAGGRQEAYKGGKHVVGVSFVGNVVDETWDILEDGRANIKRRFRLVATTEAPALTLTFDFFEMDFNIVPLGKAGFLYKTFEAEGRSHVDGSSNFLDITLV